MNYFNKNLLVIILLLSQVFLLSACGSAKKHKFQTNRPATCKNTYNDSYQGIVKIGDPYSINNRLYEPKIEHDYKKTGVASWYGDDFHCGKTANGELFNKHQMSAAHKTLPLPSVVRVTNQSNGKSVILVVNDRGPFSKDRIIDVSEKAAVELGMRNKGIATVKVELLPNATNKLMAKISAKKKIYYKPTTKHKISDKFEIIVRETTNQKEALKSMRQVAKIGKAHLVVGANKRYKVVLEASCKDEAKKLLKKVINMGYRNAKIHSY